MGLWELRGLNPLVYSHRVYYIRYYEYSFPIWWKIETIIEYRFFSIIICCNICHWDEFSKGLKIPVKRMKFSERMIHGHSCSFFNRSELIMHVCQLRQCREFVYPFRGRCVVFERKVSSNSIRGCTGQTDRILSERDNIHLYAFHGWYRVNGIN